MTRAAKLGTVTGFVLFATWAGGAGTAAVQDTSVLVVRGGSVIDPRTGTVTANSTVVIRGERIESVGPGGTVPEGAQVVDATGKFVLPGLWDTHAHTRDFDGALNINHGVTSTMDMGNILDWILALAEAREKGMAVGPRIFPQGMSIGGILGQHQWAVRNAEEARWAARQNIEAGVSFLKVYHGASVEMIEAVSEEAQKAGLNLDSHLRLVDAREAILAGVNALAHGGGIAAATSPPEAAARVKSGELGRELGTTAQTANHLQDPAMFDDLIKLMLEHNVRLEPNIVQLYRGIYDEWDRFQLESHRLVSDPNLDYIPEMFIRMWASDFNFGPYPPQPDLYQKLRKGLENHKLFTKKFADAGGKLLVGTDNYYHCVAGIAVWQEMELIASAGVKPSAILQGATINAAEYVHQDKNLGTVEAGKLADLIIVGKNPLENISNIRTLETVIQHGKVQELGYRPDYRSPIPRPYQRVNNALPRPYISSIEPAAVPIGTESLVLTITGRDFDGENRVLWEGKNLRVLEVTPTVVKVVVPRDLLAAPGTYKINMITGGRVEAESLNFGEVMVTFGRTFTVRWNGQTRTKEF